VATVTTPVMAAASVRQSPARKPRTDTRDRGKRIGVELRGPNKLIRASERYTNRVLKDSRTRPATYLNSWTIVTSPRFTKMPQPTSERRATMFR
jgi:hypothetical protein